MLRRNRVRLNTASHPAPGRGQPPPPPLPLPAPDSRASHEDLSSDEEELCRLRARIRFLEERRASKAAKRAAALSRSTRDIAPSSTHPQVPVAASSRQFPGRLASVRDRGTPVRRLQVTPAAPPAPPVAVPAPASSLSPSNAEKVKTRRVAADQRDATARKAVWEKCHGTTSTHLQKLQVNNKIREIAKDSNCRLERPWLQFEDYARTALVTEVQQHPEVGAKYGLTKADCTLLIKTICRDYCRNRGASERRRVRRSEAADPSEGGLRPRESGDDLFLGREEDDGYLSLGARSQLMASIVAAASGL